MPIDWIDDSGIDTFSFQVGDTGRVRGERDELDRVRPFTARGVLVVHEHDVVRVRHEAPEVRVQLNLASGIGFSVTSPTTPDAARLSNVAEILSCAASETEATSTAARRTEAEMTARMMHSSLCWPVSHARTDRP
jgi:hypothetical protein